MEIASNTAPSALYRTAAFSAAPADNRATPPSEAGKTETARPPAQVSETDSVDGLTEEEQAQLQELKARDKEVRAHEQAHKTVGGKYAGAISYEFQRGPDGQNYAIGGEVPINIAPEDTPEATITKMQIVIAAALAPAEPSAQDRNVARQAQAQLQEARVEQYTERSDSEADIYEATASKPQQGLEGEDSSDRLISIAATAYEGIQSALNGELEGLSLAA